MELGTRGDKEGGIEVEEGELNDLTRPCHRILRWSKALQEMVNSYFFSRPRSDPHEKLKDEQRIISSLFCNWLA